MLMMISQLSKLTLHSLSSVKRYHGYFLKCLSKREYSGKNIMGGLELTGILLKRINIQVFNGGIFM